jgi:WD40 repeat protein
MPEANVTVEAPGQMHTTCPKQLWYGVHAPAANARLGTGRVDLAPSALTSLSVSQDGEALLSASRDGSVGYWKVVDVQASSSEAAEGDGLADEDAKRKRRKGINGKASSSASQAKRPSALLWHSAPALLNTDVYAPSNNARVSQAVFAKSSSDVAYSAGYDGRVIEWDLFGATQGGNPKLSQKTSDKVILCLDSMTPSAVGGSGSAVCVTGHMDRSIGVWDMRSGKWDIGERETSYVICSRSTEASLSLCSTYSIGEHFTSASQCPCCSCVHGHFPPTLLPPALLGKRRRGGEVV